MTNEQREAIELLERIHASYFLSGMIEQSNYIVDKAYETDKAIDTVLSLIKEQQEEIEKLKVNLAKSCADRALDRETLKNQENENLEALHRAYNEELQKKDMQIDLMAEMIDELSEYYTRYHGKNNEFCKEICIKKDIDCIDCIKQYFETKAKKGE